MDIFLIIGLVLGAICIVMALILKGASVAMLLNGEVAVIIFGGMIAAVLSSYTMADIKRLPKVMKVLMSNEEPDLNGTIEKLVELSNIARREGLLALEAPVNELDDPFMKQGLELVVDGAEAEQIRDLMESEVDAMETRHHRMSGLFKTAGATSPWVIKAIEQVMKSKFTSFDEAETEKVGGVNTLVNILNSASRSTEKNIIDDLEKRQPELGAEVKANLFTFDDIITLEGRDVQKVLRDVPNDVLELALKGSAEDIREFIFKNLSTRAADNIREDLEYMGPVRLSSVEEAQQKVVAVIRRLDDAGEIYIGRGEQDAVVK